MSRAPDYILKALNKATDERSGPLGCAWANENGSLSLVLNMCVQITANKDVVLTLFPNDIPAPEKRTSRAKAKRAALAPVAEPAPVASAQQAASDKPTSFVHRIK